MTPTDEATFIALWQQGASYREIAQALDCPLGTVASRSAALAAQGKIQPRPRGAPPDAPRPGRRTHPRRHPRRHPRPHPRTRRSPPARPPRSPSGGARSARIDPHRQGLSGAGGSPRSGHPRRHPPPPAPAIPPASHPRADVKQWTVRLSQSLIEAVKAQATEGKEPSHVVEELLWKA